MAPLPVIAGVNRVAINWAAPTVSQIGVNVMHFEDGGLDPADFFTALDSAWIAGQQECMTTSAGAASIDITPLDGTSATYRADPEGENWAGGQSGDFSPASAVVVSIRTSLRGRSYRGRVFLPFTAENVIGEGSLTSGVQSDLATAWAGFLGRCATAGITNVVASYKHSTAQPAVAYDITAAIGTQRRRQSRVRYP